MHHPVDRRCRGHGVVEDLIPLREDQVRGDQPVASTRSGESARRGTLSQVAMIPRTGLFPLNVVAPKAKRSRRLMRAGWIGDSFTDARRDKTSGSCQRVELDKWCIILMYTP